VVQGFLGSHLCERLLSLGHEVICLDNFFTGRRAYLSHIRDNPSFEVIRHDVAEPISLEVDGSTTWPARRRRCTTSSTRQDGADLGAGRDQHAVAGEALNARMLQASTSEVYGDPAVHPQREDYWAT
jgi:UDP-glucuronate decarboxylase